MPNRLDRIKAKSGPQVSDDDWRHPSPSDVRWLIAEVERLIDCNNRQADEIGRLAKIDSIARSLNHAMAEFRDDPGAYAEYADVLYEVLEANPQIDKADSKPMGKWIYCKNDPQSKCPIGLNVYGTQLNLSTKEADIAWRILRDSLSSYFYCEIQPKLFDKYVSKEFDAETLLELRKEMENSGLEDRYPEMIGRIAEAREQARRDKAD